MLQRKHQLLPRRAWESLGLELGAWSLHFHNVPVWKQRQRAGGGGRPREGKWWRPSSGDLPGACGSLVQSVTCPAGWVKHGRGQGTWGLGEAGTWPQT